MEPEVTYDVIDPSDESRLGFIRNGKFYDTHLDPDGMELGHVEGGRIISWEGRTATIVGMEVLMDDGTPSLKLVPRA